MSYDPNQEPKLRVLPRIGPSGPKMVQIYEASNSRRFVGLKFDATLGATFGEVDDKGKPTGRQLQQGGFVMQSDVVELPMSGEYLRHLRDGDLWPADEKTASLCGVAFDKTFNGEHTLKPAPSAPAVVTKVPAPAPADGKG